MSSKRTWLAAALFALPWILGTPLPATAQTTVRVIHDDTTIWKADFVVKAAVVNTGAVLTVVRTRGDFFEVILPGTDAAHRSTGFVFKSNVEASGAPAPTKAAQARPAATLPKASTPTSAKSSGFGFVGFGQFGYEWFAARNSFEAVLGNGGGAVLGGGGEFRVHGFFVNGSVEHFSKTGQRVFVDEGRAFSLGIPDTIDMTPIAVTGGWRFVGKYVTPYGGAGFGRVLYKESSSFADASENVDTSFSSYHGVGGVEFRNGWVATTFEVMYSRVNAPTTTGTMNAFGENNLGGFSGRIKILVGWSGDRSRN